MVKTENLARPTSSITKTKLEPDTDEDEADDEEYSEWFGLDPSPIFTTNEILEMKEEVAEMQYCEEEAGVEVDDYYEEDEEEVATAHDVEHDGYEAADDLPAHPDIRVELMRPDNDEFDPETSTCEEDLDSGDQDLPCM